MKPRVRSIRPQGADYQIQVVGDRVRPLKDFYHALLKLSWPMTFGVIALGFLGVNTLFALAFAGFGGVANAHPGSFADAFYFSVQTMGTVGYGAMYPQSTAANLLVVLEAITGLILTALVTGLVFAKFSRPTARVVFSKNATISPHNGVPTLIFRIGNERGNALVDARIRVVLSRTEFTTEGEMIYRLIDLKLAREFSASLGRSLTIMHVIDESSPFYGQTPESIARQDLEFGVLVVGLDDTSMQMVHAAHNYFVTTIVWGARPADILEEESSGSIILDLKKFHDVIPTQPTASFPYPRE